MSDDTTESVATATAATRSLSLSVLVAQLVERRPG